MFSDHSCKWVKWLFVFVLAGLFAHLICRVLVADSFEIKTSSMEPTLQPGQRVRVSKYLMGPRIYTKFNFNTPDLHCVRLHGSRRLCVGDVAVFNYPYGWQEDTIGFKINYVYCKRCWGVPGDTIHINGGYLRGGEYTLLPILMERIPEIMHDFASLYSETVYSSAGHFAGESDNWTIRDLGPIVIPKRGVSVQLDSVTMRHYSNVIAWETRNENGRSYNWQDNNEEKEYTFQQDWYFFVGDNLTNSWDSRYFGFVPEDFIIGIVPGI